MPSRQPAEAVKHERIQLRLTRDVYERIERVAALVGKTKYDIAAWALVVGVDAIEAGLRYATEQVALEVAASDLGARLSADMVDLTGLEQPDTETDE